MATDKFSKYAYLKALHGRKIQPSHYRVLVTMLDHANGDGTKSHRGVVKLAADCGMHVETVKKAIRWLRENGYVIEVYSGWRYGGASIYNFPLRPQGSLEASLGREAENGETPANEGSPQASPPEEDQYTDASLTASSEASTSTEAAPPGGGKDLGESKVALGSGSTLELATHGAAASPDAVIRCATGSPLQNPTGRAALDRLPVGRAAPGTKLVGGLCLCTVCDHIQPDHADDCGNPWR